MLRKNGAMAMKARLPFSARSATIIFIKDLFFLLIAGLFPRSSWRTGANNRGNTPARTKTDQGHEDAYRGKAQEE